MQSKPLELFIIILKIIIGDGNSEGNGALSKLKKAYEDGSRENYPLNRHPLSPAALQMELILRSGNSWPFVWDGDLHGGEGVFIVSGK